MICVGEQKSTTENEAINPFYNLVGPDGLKEKVISWIRNVSSCAKAGDRIIIILIGHGQPNTANVVLNSRAGQEYLTKTEISASLQNLPSGVRVMLVNEACYSGAWAPIALDAGARQDIIVKAASPVGEPSFNFQSKSGQPRCSLFACAYVEELNTYPEGKIAQHCSRIKEEMKHVAPTQPTTGSTFLPSSRSLWSYSVSHFVLTPSIASAIMNIASEGSRHEELLRTGANARTLWARLRRSTQADQGLANADTGQGHLDMQLLSIQTYLDELSDRAFEEPYSGLAFACKTVLNGKGGEVLKGKCVNTIIWQETQKILAKGIIDSLIDNDHIMRPVDFPTAMELNIDKSFMAHLWTQFGTISEFENMQYANEEADCLPVYYPDAAQWVLRVLEYNNSLSSSAFNLDKVQEAVTDYLRHPSAILN